MNSEADDRLVPADLITTERRLARDLTGNGWVKQGEQPAGTVRRSTWKLKTEGRGEWRLRLAVVAARAGGAKVSMRVRLL